MTAPAESGAPAETGATATGAAAAGTPANGMARWRRQRRLRTALTAAGVVTVLTVGAASAVGLGGRTHPAPARTAPAAATVPVVRQTLVDYATADGQVSYPALAPVSSRAPGTVTWLPPVGATVRRGGTLLRVDDQPVVLLYGALPMYRPLAKPAIGNDVHQFEANLRALGYRGFAVDRAFDDHTAAAVRRWQHDLGRPETGSVGLGQVEYAPGALRVSGQLVRVGSPTPADVLAASGTTRVVTATVDAARSTWAVAGAMVTIALPDGTTVDGVVDTVASGSPAGDGAAGAGPADGGSANGPGDGSAGGSGGSRGSSLQLTIMVPDQRALAGAGAIADAGPLQVRHAVRERKRVLTVPVAALLALAEGGYGLETVGQGEQSGGHVIAVRTGMFAGGLVEVSGAGISNGMRVRVPA